MKILHVTSGIKGGARLAANRLAQFQNDHGLIAMIASTDKSNLYFKSGIIFRVIRKANTSLQFVNTKREYEIFSTSSIRSLDFKKIASDNFDLFHIHNWFNLLNPNSILRLSELAPIVFTMHDERLFTGGCHNTYSCQNFKNNCKSCPGVFLNIGQTSRNKSLLNSTFSKIERYSVTAPSEWIIKKGLNLPIIQNAVQVKVIPNVIDIPKLYRSNKFREHKKWELLFVASDISDERKGLGNLIDALDLVKQSSVRYFHLNIVGGGKFSKTINFPHTYHNFLKGQNLVKVLDASDLCIVPSLAENFPNVLIEAIARGVLVLTTNTGGSTELILDGVTGFISEPTSMKLSTAILKILDLDKVMLRKIVQESQTRAKEKLSSIDIHNSYLNIYSELINR